MQIRPTPDRRSLLGLLSLAVVLLTGFGLALAPAAAQAAGAADFSLQLSSSSPNSATGLATHLLLRNSSDRNAKPPALQSVVIHAPDGIRFNSKAAPECTASATQIQLLGPNACPADSRLTVGSFSAMSGFGPPIDPLVGDDHVFNGASELIEIITFPGTSLSPASDHLRINGSTITAKPPTVPGGPPDGKMAVRSIDFRIPPVVSSTGGSLVTTPRLCPVSGQWTTTATFHFQDGSTATASSRTPCRSGVQRTGTRAHVRSRPRQRSHPRPRRHRPRQ